MSILHQVRVVLHRPQDPVNIAAVVRAMKNMGVRDLWMVEPVAYDPYRIEGVAHNTRDVVERIRHVATLDEALADCVHVVAFHGKRRAARWPVQTPREMAPELVQAAADGPVALLFGQEDHGLPNEAVDRAHRMVTIPTTEHFSLNVAQAVLLALYELHVAAGDASVAHKGPKHKAPAATKDQYEQAFERVLEALHAIDFLKTRHPELIMRTVRSLAYRAMPDAREIELVKAMGIEVGRAMDRARRGVTLVLPRERRARAADGVETPETE